MSASEYGKSRQWMANREVSLDHRTERQGAFDLSDGDFVPAVFGGREWMVYKNANLSIHTGKDCNADCQFCVAQVRYATDGLVYEKPSIADNGSYLKALEKAMKAAGQANPSCSITGGEPSVHPWIGSLVDTLESAGARKRTMTTNGSGLLLPLGEGGPALVDRLGSYGLEHLNISRAHHDQQANSRIMRLPRNVMNDDILAESIARAKSHGIRPRLSCALLREGVCDVDGMLRYVDWAYGMGADNIIFRELMTSSERASGPRVEYCDSQRVGLSEIWDEMDRRGIGKVTHSLVGYYYYVEVRQIGASNVAGEAADLRMIAPARERFEKRLGRPVAFEMVFHPNGNLCAGWREHENVMESFS